MRLLLDANLSPRGIAARLRKGAHDVLALAEDATFEGLADPQVLEFAAAQQRVLITRNSRDFAPLAREWAQAGRSHAGIILIWTLDHSQFAKLVTGVERQLRERPSQEQCATSPPRSEPAWTEDCRLEQLCGAYTALEQ